MKPGVLNQVAAALASGFYLSHALYRLTNGRFKIGLGCGLVGSAWGVVFWGLWPVTSLPISILTVSVLTVISIFIATAAESVYNKKDDPRIVIDEFAGLLWAAVWLPKTWPAMVGAFVAFRIFDVWKPLGIRRLEQLPKGLGCVADDVASGLVAGALVKLVLNLSA